MDWLRDFFQRSFTGPYWDQWPFGPGYGDWLATLTRFLFVGLILAAICLFLRLLFGPKGLFRDKEMEQEAMDKKVKELAELTRQLQAGEISEEQFRLRKRSLEI